MKKFQSVLATALFAVSLNASALDVSDANCKILVNHFDVTGGWFTGLVVQNLTGAQDITIKTFKNDALSAGGSLDDVASSSSDFSFIQAEKKVWTLAQTNPDSNPALLATGEPTGWLFVLANSPIEGFVLFGKEAGSESVAALGPLQSEIDADCNFGTAP